MNNIKQIDFSLYPKNLFGTDGIRSRYGKFPVNCLGISILIKVLCSLIAKTSSKVDLNPTKIVLAFDPRKSSLKLFDHFMHIIKNKQIDCIPLGMVSSSECAYATYSLQADFGIMISASHNEYLDNGFKIFDSSGYKISPQQELMITKLIIDAAKNTLAAHPQVKSEFFCDSLDLINLNSCQNNYYAYDYNSEYLAISKRLFKKYLIDPLGDFYHTSSVAENLEIVIVIDCANGALSRRSKQILKNVNYSDIFTKNTKETKGAKGPLVRFIFVADNPNGQNINDNVGSTNTNYLSKQIKNYNASFGFAFDGDGDRIMLVGGDGNVVEVNLIIAALTLWFKKNNMLKNNCVVSTIMANQALFGFFQKCNIKFMQTMVGDKNIAECIKKNDLIFGAEPSGHFLFNFKNQIAFDNSCDFFGSCGDSLLSAILLCGYYIHRLSEDINFTWQDLTCQGLCLFKQLSVSVRVSAKPDLYLMPKVIKYLEDCSDLIQKETYDSDESHLTVNDFYNNEHTQNHPCTNPQTQNQTKTQHTKLTSMMIINKNNHRILWRYSGTEDKLRILFEYKPNKQNDSTYYQNMVDKIVNYSIKQIQCFE